jgi:hypothetical protein
MIVREGNDFTEPFRSGNLQKISEETAFMAFNIKYAKTIPGP